jgi:hypothetical protein
VNSKTKHFNVCRGLRGAVLSFEGGLGADVLGNPLRQSAEQHGRAKVDVEEMENE